MQRCGEGTPMFSRCGKETSNQYKCFAEKDEHSSSVRSSLAQFNITRQTKVTHDEIDFVLEKMKVRNLRV